MKSTKTIFLMVILLLFIFSSCSKDESGKPEIFIYALLGVGPDFENPNEDRHWVYARIFNHPKNQSVKAELIKGTEVISLQGNYWEVNKSFSEGRLDFYFIPYDDYKFRMWDSKNTFTGNITTLPRLNITQATATLNQIVLEWTDINADFYDVELRNSDFEKHYQLEDNQITIYLSELPLGVSTSIDIDISGFKGFSPLSNPGSNIKGCYGYLFGYSKDATELDLQSMSFLNKNISNTTPDLDNLILGFYNNSSKNTPQNSSIDFSFTYAYISNASYSQNGYNYFHSATIVEPANAISHIEGDINGKELKSYSWGGFYHTLSSDPYIYDYYDSWDQYTFFLSINDMFDVASISIPDTFSIINQPKSNTIPQSPFQIGWRNPENADFFFVNSSWKVKGDSISKNYFYATENNSFQIIDIPENSIGGRIWIIAVNGSSPMNSLKPNLTALNGYYFARRYSFNTINFSEEPGSKNYFNSGLMDENSLESSIQLDKFIINKLAEKNPVLLQHKQELIRKINQQ